MDDQSAGVRKMNSARASLRPGTLCFAAAFALANGSAARAQTADQLAVQAAADTAAAQKLHDEGLAILAGGSKDSTSFGTVVNAFHLETTGDKTSAALALGFHRTHPTSDKPDGTSRRVTSATDSLSLVVTAPLGQDGAPSVFDFHHPGNDTSVELKAVRYWGTVRFDRNDDPNGLQVISNNAVGRCVYGEAQKWALGENDLAAAEKIHLQFLKALAETLPQTQGLYDPALREVADHGAKEIQPLALALESCINITNKGGLASAAAYIKPEEAKAISGSRAGGLWFLGVAGSFSRAKYKFITQAPLANSKVSHNNYEAKAFGGHVFGSGNLSLSGSLAYGRSYESGASVQLCEPNGVGSQLACFTGPLGPPARTDEYIGAMEVRWQLALPGVGKGTFVGIAPRISYEIKSNSALIDVPIYFIPSKDTNSLNGGLRFGYNTADKEFGIGLFVGVPFSLFFN